VTWQYPELFRGAIFAPDYDRPTRAALVIGGSLSASKYIKNNLNQCPIRSYAMQLVLIDVGGVFVVRMHGKQVYLDTLHFREDGRRHARPKPPIQSRTDNDESSRRKKDRPHISP